MVISASLLRDHIVKDKRDSNMTASRNASPISYHSVLGSSLLSFFSMSYVIILGIKKALKSH